MAGIIRRAATSLLLLLAAVGTAAAQDYPTKPITLVAPFAAGSATDSVVRIIGAKLSERLKKAVVIENKAGANAQIGAEYVARAAPDGYTLLFATSTSHSSNPSLYKVQHYDPIKDFTPIGRAVDITYLLLANADLPVKSVADLVAYAKANPEKLSYATPNSPSLVVSESMRIMADIKIVGVPYKASPQAMTDFMGGQVELYVADVPSALPLVRNGKARALAITSLQRSALLPEVPPLADSFPGIDIVSWGGLVGPAGIPRPIVDKLFAELQETLADKGVQDKLVAAGFTVEPSKSPDEFATYLRYQLDTWSRLVNQARIEAQ